MQFLDEYENKNPPDRGLYSDISLSKSPLNWEILKLIALAVFNSNANAEKTKKTHFELRQIFWALFHRRIRYWGMAANSGL